MSENSCPGREAFRTGEDYRDHLLCEDCEPKPKPPSEWNIGDLCTCTYGNVGKGIVYRVTKVNDRLTSWGRSTQLDITPVHGVLADVEHHRPRRGMGAGYYSPLTLVDLSTMYANLGNFIREEATRRGRG